MPKVDSLGWRDGVQEGSWIGKRLVQHVYALSRPVSERDDQPVG